MQMLLERIEKESKSLMTKMTLTKLQFQAH